MLKKAEKRIEKALGTFTKAKDEVEQANAMLVSELNDKSDDISQKQEKITSLQQEIERENTMQEFRKNAIEDNKNLISELDKFIPKQ